MITNKQTSYPSAPVTFIDVPEVSNFNAEFDYKYFVVDESLDYFSQQIFTKNFPRFVKFSFKPVVDNKKILNKNSILLKEYSENILYEHDATSTKFVGVNFHDTQLDKKLVTIVSGTIADRVARYNDGILQQFNATAIEIENVLHHESINLFDVAQLMSINSDNEGVDSVLKSVANLVSFNAQFIDENKQNTLIDEQFERINNVNIDAQLNAKFCHTLLKSAITDPVSIHTDEISPLIDIARSTQDNAQRSMNSTGINALEYETFIQPLSVRQIDITSFDGYRRIVGYIIDKTEIRNDGTSIVHEPIIISQPLATQAIDTAIVYNRKYVYCIRTIAEIEFVTQLDDNIVAATVLVSSKPSIRRIIHTIENIPPPSPADFNVKWDCSFKAPRLTWAFPVNQQRDIKMWRIFKRATINEPFELIQEINFDDSIIKNQSVDVDERLITHTTNPINFYIDYSFHQAKQCIYTICSVDAHGLMSNYSSQFIVNFNLTKGKTITKLLSIANAPASYPNMFITQDDIIVDVITDSQHKQIDIFFDPDAFNYNKNNNTTNIVKTQDVGKYRLQIFNCDLQRDDAVDIIIKDHRKK